VWARVCGVSGTLWVCCVSASKVFDEMWAREVLAKDDAALGLKRSSSGAEVLLLVSYRH
jgi:hypothetical protein